MTPKPVLDGKPTKVRTPEAGVIPPSRKWTFSLRCWRQADYFGLDTDRVVSAHWFVALLNRLRELCFEDVDAFRASGYKHEVLRYHEVNWGAPNIPIARRDCTWVPREYLENEVDYPFYQFQISTALGRVAGFWDEQQVFNIVMLDPLHNLQPAKDYNYRVEATGDLRCEYSELLHKLDTVCDETTCGASCATRARFLELRAGSHLVKAIVIPIDEEQRRDVLQLVNDGRSLREILETGLITLA
ncbi:MAG TPA: hypothetical protein VH062_07680 [Polyangiaceae bacterium]|nr:hypothetical protein [Polyangiaceae bacterium]